MQHLPTGLAARAFLAPHPDLFYGALPWGGGLWVLSALNRADGGLARSGDMTRPGGHRYDYLVCNGVDCLFFLAIGVGLRHAGLFGHDPALWMIAPGALSGAWGFRPDDARPRFVSAATR